MTPKHLAIADELESIRLQHRGVLRAVDVVAFASDSGTCLHARFNWDDTSAAAEYRLWQARELIRVVVTMLPNHNEPLRAFVSLMEDRSIAGGGYRSTVSVLSHPRRRALMLAQALADMETFAAKYRGLAELSAVFAAMDGTRGRIKPVKPVKPPRNR